MPRVSRIVAVGYPHHITQRGNYRQSVYENEEDYTQYLQWLKEYSHKHSLKIWAYCLMSNHVHFVAVPMKEDSLAKTFNTLHMRYAQYFNQKNKVKGHLWQGRFYSCILDESHLYAAIRYVENNPVRARIVKKAHEYKWSSAKAHVDKEVDLIISNDCYLTKKTNNWSAYLAERDDEAVIKNITENTKTGRPCGDKSFIKTMERLLERTLIALPRGRPHKEK